jgi:hypothetical protein
MTTDWKALCAELADALAEWQLGGGPPEDTADADLIERARAALTQPEPEGPTDEELMTLAYKCDLLEEDGTTGYREDADLSDVVATFARAVLAHWSRAIVELGPPQ